MTDNDTAQPDYIERDEPHDETAGTGLAIPDQRLPDKLYLLPISNRPIGRAHV